MNYEAIHRLTAAAPEVIAALVDPAFLTSLDDLPTLAAPEVLEHRAEGAQIHVAVRLRFRGHLPPAVTAVLDPRRLSWVEHLRWDPASGHATVRVVPDHYANRLRSDATLDVAADGERGSTFRRAGRVKVSYPIVGGQVERAIVSGLKENVAAQAAALDRWLSS